MEILGFATGPYQTNCYAVISGDQVSVIDPGMYTQPQIEAFLAERAASLAQIVLTHGHIDHIRDAAALANKWGVPVCIHESDAEFLDKGKGMSKESLLLFAAEDMPLPKHMLGLEHKQHIELGGEQFEVLHGPGHSPGSVLLVGSEFCFSGDILFKGSIGRTDLIHSDPQSMQETLKNQVLSLDDSLQILPGHGLMTTMRAERMYNPYLRSLV
ncbi:Metallo-beta-lactamase superfamily protein [Corynebacterium pseudotuberculosis]|uniref:MBL fold metallo-hydrolase n=1 Tax=Corynebacterium pseudotuberculosis TaxID=1719 RepID=UPI000CDBC88A|nr:MBL fold metallo-hydrolase [Corynebacterium pseudotuberculosis]AUZ43348.1 Metallo-beta-lactamase superfamily protein [Corynebacterium pseudotuberculosis]